MPDAGLLEGLSIGPAKITQYKKYLVFKGFTENANLSRKAAVAKLSTD